MMEQLGITKLRPGPSGQPNATNSANYDQAKANPFPNLPPQSAGKVLNTGPAAKAAIGCKYQLLGSTIVRTGEKATEMDPHISVVN